VEKHDTTVYVGNLPWKATEDDLLSLFREYGPVTDVRIIQDPVTGRSRGYGFVELEGTAAVAQAVALLNGKEFQGRALMVSLARPKPPREA
jgi:RNA recognition motif-containing protein